MPPSHHVGVIVVGRNAQSILAGLVSVITGHGQRGVEISIKKHVRIAGASPVGVDSIIRSLEQLGAALGKD